MKKLSFIVSYFIRVKPLVQGYMATKPLSTILLCRTRLSVSVVCSDVLAGEASVLWGC